MKKLLFGTTALAGALAFAGGATAQEISLGGALDLTISGVSEFEVEWADEDLGFTSSDEDAPREWFFNQDHEVRFLAIGVGDATGITYGVDLQLELDTGDGENAQWDEAFIFVEGNFGRFELGDEDGATDTLTIAAQNIAAGTGGIDGAQRSVGAAFLFDSGEATKITYFTPLVAGFQAGVSYAIDGDDRGSNGGSNEIGDFIELGGNWQGAFGGFDLGVFGGAVFADAAGFGEEEDDEGILPDDFVGDSGVAWTIGGLVGAYGFELAGAYGSEDGDDGVAEIVGIAGGEFLRDNFWNIGIGTEFAGVAGSFTFQRDSGEDDETYDQFVFSADTGLLPGVSLQGDIPYVYIENDYDVDESGVNAVARLAVSF